jgi:hypothetical protein
VGFPVAEHTLTRRRQFIFGDPSSNDFSNYDVAQSTTKDFDDLIMRQLSHLYFSPTNPSETRENGQWAILGSLLHAEPVHADESLRIFHFELVPSIKVGHRGILGESCGIGTLLRRTEHEAEELQIVLVQEAFDLRQTHPVLLDVEHQVTAAVSCDSSDRLKKDRYSGKQRGVEMNFDSPTFAGRWRGSQVQAH